MAQICYAICVWFVVFFGKELLFLLLFESDKTGAIVERMMTERLCQQSVFSEVPYLTFRFIRGSTVGQADK